MTDGRIDVHAHYLAPDYLEALHKAERWLLGGIPVPEWSPQLALEFMDAHGIAMQLLSVSHPGVEFVSREEPVPRARVQRLRRRGRARAPGALADEPPNAPRRARSRASPRPPKGQPKGQRAKIAILSACSAMSASPRTRPFAGSSWKPETGLEPVTLRLQGECSTS